MPEALPELDISWLTTAQRLELIARLWDSIPDSLEDLPIPDWHRHELERGLPRPTRIRKPASPGRRPRPSCGVSHP